jgi:DNA invertase Pin-like site-specific DNA recombinase
LEQSFNSLDAQREACEAYILSQRHEGWQAVSSLYDDGGFSGGNIERPALKRLLADIAAKRVDTVVVYKVDRLTRSLADFAKIVEQFDKQGVSFVSVTQQFNTTTSMGRLTLNVLLFFAQFEREVTGERIRDKIAASKRKGMWMGGVVPLGYDLLDHQLILNPEEAKRVKTIFRAYLTEGCVSKLQIYLEKMTSAVRNGSARQAMLQVAMPFRAARSIFCFRIVSIWAKSCIKKSHIRASIQRLLIEIYGIRFRTSSNLICKRSEQDRGQLTKVC